MQPNHSFTYDTIILGGGIVGAATAEALVRRGHTVLLLEQFAPGHTRGSSHGDGRIIRFAYPEPIYIEMALLAYPGWASLAERAGEPLVQTTGGWDAGPAASPHLHELEENFRRYHIPYERLSAAESNRRFPHFYLEGSSEAIFQPEAGVVFATSAVLALWRLFEAAGGIAVTGERVEAIEVLGEQIRVRSVSGVHWQARHLVVAAGGWSRTLLAALGLSLPLEAAQEQVAYFAPRDEMDHRAGAMPIFIDYHTEYPFYGLPQIQVPGVKIGWHHTGPVIDPDDPQPFDHANLLGVQDFVRARLPHLNPESFEQITCLYTNTPDYHFILDRHPEFPNIVVGTGFSGHGFKFAPVLGDILAALVLGEATPLDLSPFAISRFERANLSRRTGA
ncbi:MAG: N-methyl-L-tryptophan oxidase [Ardenticatenales bacterium]|nr:N-methyl-L-tryptophan oxidase [Ardenticatenales bacterium]